MFTMGDGSRAIPHYDKHSDVLVLKRLAALGYYDESDDSGSGSALNGILDAASTLGSAYILSQRQPQTTSIPTNTRPAYGAATPGFASGGTFGSGGLLLFGLLALGAVGLFIAFGRG
jgi:hypothetical protein